LPENLTICKVFLYLCWVLLRVQSRATGTARKKKIREMKVVTAILKGKKVTIIKREGLLPNQEDIIRVVVKDSYCNSLGVVIPDETSYPNVREYLKLKMKALLYDNTNGDTFIDDEDIDTIGLMEEINQAPDILTLHRLYYANKMTFIVGKFKK